MIGGWIVFLMYGTPLFKQFYSNFKRMERSIGLSPSLVMTSPPIDHRRIIDGGDVITTRPQWVGGPCLDLSRTDVFSAFVRHYLRNLA